MARAVEIPTDLTLDIGGDVSPDEFIAAVQNFFAYVREITDARQDGGVSLDWTVKVKQGSSLVGLEPSDGAPASLLMSIYDDARSGAQALERGDAHQSGLSKKAIKRLRALTELSGKSAGRAKLQMWIRKEPVALTMSEKAATRVEKRSYSEFGTIEGRLEGVQDANGSLKLSVRDLLYPRPITCKIPDHLMKQALKCFRRRVELTGEIHFQGDDAPVRIDAIDIQLLPEDDALPSAGDVRGILAQHDPTKNLLG
jgi:hypothetical protein